MRVLGSGHLMVLKEDILKPVHDNHSTVDWLYEGSFLSIDVDA